MRKYTFWIAVLALQLVSLIQAEDGRPGAEVPASELNPGRWKWLEGTYWYVPKTNLPAMSYSNRDNSITPVADQTVYVITGYKDGYFWGRTAVQISGSEKQFLALFGSITPEGKVLLTFIPFDSGVRGLVTQGAGRMRYRFGQWTMENQMTSGPNSAYQIAHWAYMLQLKRGSEQWKSLPGVNVSVGAFFQGCPEAPEYNRP